MSKYEFIDEMRLDTVEYAYSVEYMCNRLDVSRSGYYEWRGRPDSATAQRRDELKLLIKKAFEDSARIHRLMFPRSDFSPRADGGVGLGFEGGRRPPRSGRGLSEVFCESGLGRWCRWPVRPSGCGVDGGRQGVDGG
ncbi:hypothetical protein [Streptomyces sp. NBC_01217]|uniref:hypothetical protein n=1 Tax=Streptomyces sp. NBC_01217 TaxID=2903779 RepID=UPI002E0FD353|nr:hypothetical protein OG507_00590 [Streptomyces sp. NBC_01217]